jgi:hypothetical protein
MFMEMGLLAMSIWQGWFREKMASYFWIMLRWKLVKLKRQSVVRRRENLNRILDSMNPAVTFEEIQNPVLGKFVNPLLTVYYRILVRP